jgi:hypothetical protein
MVQVSCVGGGGGVGPLWLASLMRTASSSAQPASQPPAVHLGLIICGFTRDTYIPASDRK